jgi:hypothetical protein
MKKIEPCLVALLLADNTFSETVEKIFEKIISNLNFLETVKHLSSYCR